MSYAIHNQNPAFNDSAIAQYMNTDFIVLDIALCVALAREQFFAKLKDDDIPSHIFIEDNGRLAGMIAVRKLLQTADTLQPVKSLMISQFLQVKPEDERADVAGQLARRRGRCAGGHPRQARRLPDRARNRPSAGR